MNQYEIGHRLAEAMGAPYCEVCTDSKGVTRAIICLNEAKSDPFLDVRKMVETCSKSLEWVDLLGDMTLEVIIRHGHNRLETKWGYDAILLDFHGMVKMAKAERPPNLAGRWADASH